jgi:hypothetical protein
MNNRDEFPYLFVWSSILLLSAAIVLRFLHTFLTASFLRFFSISFKYTPLNIKYTTEGFGNWTIESMIVVYVLVAVFFLFFGLSLVRILKVIRLKNLKVKLFLTWLAFLSTHFLATSMIAGAVIYAEFGFAFSWMIKFLPVRIIIALFGVGVFLYFRSFWIKLFLKTAFSRRAIESYEARKTFIMVVFILPVLSATFVLAIYAYAVSSLFWLISFIGYWLHVFPVASTSIPYYSPRLVKTNDTYFFSWVTGLKMVGWLVLLLFIAFIET